MEPLHKLIDWTLESRHYRRVKVLQWWQSTAASVNRSAEWSTLSTKPSVFFFIQLYADSDVWCDSVATEHNPASVYVPTAVCPYCPLCSALFSPQLCLTVCLTDFCSPTFCLTSSFSSQVHMRWWRFRAAGQLTWLWMTARSAAWIKDGGKLGGLLNHKYRQMEMDSWKERSINPERSHTTPKLDKNNWWGFL